MHFLNGIKLFYRYTSAKGKQTKQSSFVDNLRKPYFEMTLKNNNLPECLIIAKE